MSHPIKDLMDSSIQNLHQLVDVNTIIGDPVTTPDGTTIIPVSKVTFGYASGGSEFPSSKTPDPFGGGAGAGVTIQPIAFLVIKAGAGYSSSSWRPAATLPTRWSTWCPR